jgi:hypothetical protein
MSRECLAVAYSIFKVPLVAMACLYLCSCAPPPARIHNDFAYDVEEWDTMEGGKCLGGRGSIAANSTLFLECSLFSIKSFKFKAVGMKECDVDMGVFYKKIKKVKSSSIYHELYEELSLSELKCVK